MQIKPLPKLFVFASGSGGGGGSGFQKLVFAKQEGRLKARIVGVASNHEKGGVYAHALELGIPFFHLPNPTAKDYQRIANDTEADGFALSGWLKKVLGLDPSTRFNSQTVFNIHPGPLPRFGGKGMYGHHVHEAVLAAFHRGEITHSEVCMHFVDPEYDGGPVFLRVPVEIRPDDTPETLARRVNDVEHEVQWRATGLVLDRFIRWDGVHADSLEVPVDYPYLAAA